MVHSIYNSTQETEISVDETLCENVCISVKQEDSINNHYLNPKELNSFIGILLHIQSKKRKEYGTKY